MAEQASGPTQPPQQDGKHLSPQGEVYRADLAVLVEGLRPVRPRISKQQSTGWQTYTPLFDYLLKHSHMML